jgi:hypothetical protein
MPFKYQYMISGVKKYRSALFVFVYIAIQNPRGFRMV